MRSALIFLYFVSHAPMRASRSSGVVVLMYRFPHGPSDFAIASAALYPLSTRLAAHLYTSLSHGEATIDPISL